MMHHLVSAIFSTSLLAFIVTVAADVEVDLVLEPPEIGPEATDVELKCTYNAEDEGWTVNTVDWAFIPVGGDQVRMLIWALTKENTEPKPAYQGKLEDYDGVTNSSHFMTLKDASWCTDVGKYNCYATVTDPEARSGENTTQLLALRAPGKVAVNGNDTKEDLQVEEVTGTVTCSATWNNANVRVTLKSDNDTVQADGIATGDDECTNKAEVSEDYVFNESIGSREFICTAYYEDEASHEVAITVYYGQSPTTTPEVTTVPSTTKGRDNGAAFQTVHVFLFLVTVLASLT